MRMHVMVASGLGLALCLRIAHAVDVDPLVRAHAERLAVGTCGTCHGPHGNSQLPKYPRLAGQNAAIPMPLRTCGGCRPTWMMQQ
jgi:cytochrome c553